MYTFKNSAYLMKYFIEKYYLNANKNMKNNLLNSISVAPKKKKL